MASLRYGSVSKWIGRRTRRPAPEGLSHIDPLLEEALAASLALTAFGVIVAVLYWLLTGLSPWPGLVLGEVAGFGFGMVLLTFASPRRRR